MKTSQLVAAAQSLAVVDSTDRFQAYWALRACLVTSPTEVPVFDDLFAAFWTGNLPGSDPVALPGAESMLTEPAESERGHPEPGDAESQGSEPGISESGISELPDTESAAQDDSDDDPGIHEDSGGALWSAVEVLRTTDIRELQPTELAAVRRIATRLGCALPRRISRRTLHGRGPGIDTRATVRRSMRTEGHPIELAWRSPRTRPRRVVFLVDVSGSMEVYARMLIAFAGGARESSRMIEVFAFGTRLTRLSGVLDRRRRQDPMQALSGNLADWAGGTRIGESIEELGRAWGSRGALRGAVVVIASDGWERGDTAQLRRSMEMVQRLAHAVIWVNPLAGDEDYEPLAAGMAAALPFVDDFLAGQSLRDLETLSDVLEAVPPSRSRLAGAARSHGDVRRRYNVRQSGRAKGPVAGDRNELRRVR